MSGRTKLSRSLLALAFVGVSGVALAQAGPEGGAQPGPRGQMPMMGQGQMPMMGQGQMPMMGQGQMPMMGQGRMRMMEQDRPRAMGGQRDDHELHEGSDGDEGGRAMPMRRMGPRLGWPIPAARDLTVEEVRRNLQAHLDRVGNPRLKLGPLTEQGDRVVADVVTTDNSLVQRVEIDRRSGAMRELR